MVEDMITLLEGAVQPELRKGRYPDRKTARRISEVVKAVARNSTPTPGAAIRGNTGRWHTSPPAGEFNRDTKYITTRITADGRDGYPVEPGRYRLVVARACPWANRAIIVRRLLGLEDVLSIGFCGPTHDERSWTFDLDPGGVDPVLEDPAAAGRLLQALPRLPEGHHGARDRRRADGRGRHQRLRPDDARPVDRVGRLPPPGRAAAVPEPLRAEIDEVAKRVYTEVNNGVYRCGFAGSQPAYDSGLRPAVHRAGLALRTARRVSDILVGDTITEADVRLFTTLARFDPVYHGHFKCNRQKLAEMPVLWAYARDLFQTPGFGDTVDFVQIKQHYYIVHKDINPTQDRPRGARPVELARRRTAEKHWAADPSATERRRADARW